MPPLLAISVINYVLSFFNGAHFYNWILSLELLSAES